MLGWTAPDGIAMCQDEVVEDLKQGRPSVEKIIRIGMDTSKNVFQLHGVDEAAQPVLRKKLRRNQVLGFFARLSALKICMELAGRRITGRGNCGGWGMRWCWCRRNM